MIALTFLVLLSAVVLALFGTTRTDRQNASTFATGQETMRLADAAVSLVQGQIRDATIQPRVGWASQPGMIRTFGTSGNATTAYKLYSSDEMRVSNFGPSQINAETTAMSTWNAGAANTSYNALYCDLNSPAAVKRPKPGDETQTEDALVFPIADPAAMGAVEGFSANTSVAGTVLGNATTRRLPMPVKWIYVLRDGQMTAPTSGDSSRVTFSGTPLPTQDNPIVGRIAFWADDETCKLNINTASEGSFWDIPTTSTQPELDMGRRTPVPGEYQAIAGHPASTSLSPALGSLGGQPSGTLPAQNLTTTDYENFLKPYYTLTPKISDNAVAGKTTSQGGSARTVTTSDTGGTPAGGAVIFDSDRLYATSNELLFRPDRTVNNAAITAAALSKRDFFLTAQSRAPETTIFGTPRISMWPTMTTASQQQARDRLINFCATVGSNGYYFQREQSAPISFANQAASGSARSTSLDMTAVARNREVYDYLTDRLLSTDVPGFGGRFSSKWGSSGVSQVASSSIDLLRSHANTYYKTSGKTGANANGRDWNFEVTTSSSGGYIMPLTYDGGAGFGRAYAFITEAAIALVATKSDASGATTEYQRVLLLNLYTPCPNAGAAAPGARIRVSGLGFNGEWVQKNRMGGGSNGGRNFAFPGAHTQMYQTGTDSTMRGAGNDIYKQFALVQTETGMLNATIPAGTLTVEVREIDMANPQVIQTLSMDFQAETLPLPQATSLNGTLNKDFDKSWLARGDQRLFYPGDIVRSVRFRGDTSAPHKGDLRLLALARGNVPSNWFERHPQNGQPVVAYTFDASGNLTNTAAARVNRFAHSLRGDFLINNFNSDNLYGVGDGTDGPVTGVRSPTPFSLAAGWNQGNATITPGGLVGGLTIGSNSPRNRNFVPAIPQGLSAALNSNGNPGDFTTTYGFVMDGATVAIPDFGSFLEGTGGFYTELNWSDAVGDSFEPNRQITSPVQFGTLPASNSSGSPTPWQTLLFCPNAVSSAGAAGATHPGWSANIPDHLYLDNFWMPAVEPYAISEPLSTAGKVNLNYQLAPFTHITRAAAMLGALKPVRLSAIEDSRSGNYKTDFNPGGGGNATNSFSIRYNLNLSAGANISQGSLADFEARFSAGDIFRSASEVCTIRLVPSGQTLSNLNTWWGARRLTGDNLREAPYNALYSRVTTKSNPFTVHYRVQALKQPPRAGRNWAEWEEARDQVVGEYRGSTTIERFLDPNAQNIPDYTQVNLSGNYDPIDKFYRWKVLSQKQFAP